MRKRGILLAGILVLFALTLSAAESTKVALVRGEEYQTFMTMAKSSLKRMPDLKAWEKAVPQVKVVTIPSSFDKTTQYALCYNSGSKHKKPLLLALHSWSEDYRQFYGIPYGIWAVQNDWVFIQPDYRGAFTNPRATASEAAVRDILDAVEYAKKRANVDGSRIYVVGFSGGGMMSLIMVGRYPELWAGAVSWVPVYDLVEWYKTTKNATHDYSKQIANSCSGPPLPGTRAEKECKKRSVSSYLKNAHGRNVPVYISVGIKDRFVPPGHAINAFNDLAAPKDRISQADIEYIDTRYELPPHLSGSYHDPFYAELGMDLVFERASNGAVLKLFNDGHDIIYNAGLVWLSRQRKGAANPL